MKTLKFKGMVDAVTIRDKSVMVDITTTSGEDLTVFVPNSIAFAITEEPVLDEEGNPKLGANKKPLVKKVNSPVLMQDSCYIFTARQQTAGEPIFNENGEPVLYEEGNPQKQPVGSQRMYATDMIGVMSVKSMSTKRWEYYYDRN